MYVGGMAILADVRSVIATLLLPCRRQCLDRCCIGYLVDRYAQAVGGETARTGMPRLINKQKSRRWETVFNRDRLMACRACNAVQIGL